MNTQRQLRIYQMDVRELEKEETFRQYYEMLSDMRREKVDRKKNPEGKCQTLGAGILLDRGLQEFGLREKDVRIRQGENGKPYLADYPEIHFNLSHSGHMALAVFAPREVGCDIEYIGKPNRKLAKRFFCPSEYEYLLNQPDEQSVQREFYRLWTLKESFLKATGLGLKLPMRSFCFSFDKECPPETLPGVWTESVTVSQQVDEAHYHFHESQIQVEDAEQYRVAVCIRDA